MSRASLTHTECRHTHLKRKKEKKGCTTPYQTNGGKVENRQELIFHQKTWCHLDSKSQKINRTPTPHHNCVPVLQIWSDSKLDWVLCWWPNLISQFNRRNRRKKSWHFFHCMPTRIQICVQKMAQNSSVKSMLFWHCVAQQAQSNKRQTSQAATSVSSPCAFDI